MWLVLAVLITILSARSAAAQGDDLVMIGGNATERCVTAWTVLRRSVESDYDDGNWDLESGRTAAASLSGIARRANKAAPARVRAAGIAEIDRHLGSAQQGRVPADPSLCGVRALASAGPLTIAATRERETSNNAATALGFDQCQRLQRYRDRALFNEWSRAAGKGNAYADELRLLIDARNQLVADAGVAASNWAGAAAAFAAHAKLISDLILDLSGAAGAGASATVAPLNMLAQAVKDGRTGEDGSEQAMREVFVGAMTREALRELKRLTPVGGAFASLAHNSRKLIGTTTGWSVLRLEYQRQLSAFDRAITGAEHALRTARSKQTGLEDAKQRLDEELRRCKVYQP